MSEIMTMSESKASRSEIMRMRQAEYLAELKFEVAPYHLPVRMTMTYGVLLPVCYLTILLMVVCYHVAPPLSSLSSWVIFGMITITMLIASITLFVSLAGLFFNLVITFTSFIAPSKHIPTWSMIHFTRRGCASYAQYEPSGLALSFLISILHGTHRFWTPSADTLGAITEYLNTLKRERVHNFRLDDLQSITISSDHTLDTLERSPIFWSHLKTADLEFGLTLTFFNGESQSGRCVVSGVRSRQEAIKLGVKISSIAGIEWGEILENTPNTYVITFDRAFTAKDDEERSHMINVGALIARGQGSLTELDRDERSEAESSARVDQAKSKNLFEIQEKRVDSVDDEVFIIHEKGVEGQIDQGDRLVDGFADGPIYIAGRLTDAHSDDLAKKGPLITSLWSPERDLFDRHIVIHTQSVLIYEHHKSRSIYYVYTWYALIFGSLYLFSLFDHHSSRPQLNTSTLAATPSVSPAPQSSQPDVLNILNHNVFDYVSSLPPLTVTALILGVLALTVAFLLSHHKAERLGQLRSMICRTEIQWDRLTCTQHQRGRAVNFDMSRATHIQVKIDAVLCGGKGSRHYKYNGSISLREVSESGDVTNSIILAETGEHRDRHKVYHSGLRFAALFSEKLNIELDYIEV